MQKIIRIWIEKKQTDEKNETPIQILKPFWVYNFFPPNNNKNPNTKSPNRQNAGLLLHRSWLYSVTTLCFEDHFYRTSPKFRNKKKPGKLFFFYFLEMKMASNYTWRSETLKLFFSPLYLLFFGYTLYLYFWCKAFRLSFSCLFPLYLSLRCKVLTGLAGGKMGLV